MKQLSLRSLLILQIVYFFLGNMYNVGSLLVIRNGEPAWASTDALFGVVSMSVYGLCLSTGLLKNLRLYRLLMGLLVILLGYGGVITHILNFGKMELYHSILTWCGAIVINSYGLTLNIMAVLGKFKRDVT